jgi:predicted ester cyclase
MIPEGPELQKFAESYTSAWCSQNAASVAAHFSPIGSLAINDGEPSSGRGSIMEAVQGFMTTFPDLCVVMDDIVIDGDRAEYHWTLSGTATGPGEIGNRVCISGFEVWNIGEDGLIAESRGHFDAAEYKRQMERGIVR